MARTGDGSTPFEERQNGYSESYSADGSQATRSCSVKSTNVGKFVIAMLGTRERDGENIKTRIPDQFPKVPDLYAQAVELAGADGPPNDGGPNNSIDFDNFIFHTHYSTVPYDVYDDATVTTLAGANTRELYRFVERQLETSVENIQLPSGSMTFVGDSNAIPGSAPKVVFTMNGRYVWHRVPSVPIENIKNSLGRVNSAAFDVGGLNFEENTALMLAAEIEKTWAPAGPVSIGSLIGGGLPLGGLEFHREYRITYTFLIRDNGLDTTLTPNERMGHQHLFKPSANAWRLVTHDGTAGGNRIYPTADHNDLFKLSGTTVTF